MKQQTPPENIDLFKNTFRASMPLTDDYVFHAVFGRDTEESRAALIEILNIILERKQDPIRAIVIKKPVPRNGLFLMTASRPRQACTNRPVVRQCLVEMPSGAMPSQSKEPT